MVTRKLPCFVGGSVGVLIARAATCHPNMQVGRVDCCRCGSSARCLVKRVAFCHHSAILSMRQPSTMMPSDACSLSIWCVKTQPHARSSISHPVSIRTHESRRNGGKSLPVYRVGCGRACSWHVACAYEGSSAVYRSASQAAVTGIRAYWPSQATAVHWPRLVIYLQVMLCGCVDCRRVRCSRRHLLSLRDLLET